MKILLTAALIGSMLAAGPRAAAAVRTIDGDPSDWTGATTLLGGTWQVSNGEFVYQDYIYDDYGAETRARAPQHGNFRASTTLGDFRYPTDEERYGHNAADIRELRLAATDDHLDVLLVLNTLKAPDTTVLGIGIETDRHTDDAGGGPWPFEAGIDTPGTNVVVTLWGSGGAVTDLATQTTTAVAEIATDLERNTIEARIPRSLVPGTAWRVYAASGLWDGDSWTPVPPTASTATEPGYGGATVVPRAFNVAFRDGETGTYFEDLQATALEAGEISAFFADVDLDSLGDDQPYVPETGRLYEAIVRESFTVPPHHEGQAYDTAVTGRSAGIGGAALEQVFPFYGAWQPYAVYVPRGYDADTALPAALILHGHGGAHCGFQCSANFTEQIGELPGDPMLIVSPLGRGSSMYADYGEQDVLEVLADAEARWSIDPERVYIGGYSMGGYGTFRFASFYPDRFAAAVSIAGYTGEFTGRYLYDQRNLGYPRELYDTFQRDVQPLTPLDGEGDRNINGDHVETLDGMLHVPVLQLGGSNDEILPVTGQYAAAARLDDLGYHHRFDLYPGYEHLTFAIVDDWTVVREWFGSRRRVTSPRTVAYRYSDASIDPDIGMPLVHGRAYWVEATQLRERDATKPSLVGGIHATSLPATPHTSEPVLEPALAPTPNLRMGIARTDGSAEPPANALEVGLENLRRAVVDGGGAGLDGDLPATFTITTDGLTTVEIRGTFGPATIVEGDAVVSQTTDVLSITVADAGRVVVAAG